jgi:hypothetical protein
VSNGEVLYVIHDTNQKSMPEVASYTATHVDFQAGSAVVMFRNDDTLVAIHHLAPGHCILPVHTDAEDDEPHSDAAWTIESYGSIKDGVVTETKVR